MTRIWIAVFLAACTLGLLPGSVARAAEVSASEATKLVAQFDRQAKTQAPAKLVRAITRLGEHQHAKIATRLCKLALDEKTPTGVRIAAFNALSGQPASAKALCSKVDRWIAARSTAAERALARGDIGVPLHPDTGEPQKDTDAAREAIREGREQADLLAAALTSRLALGDAPRDAAKLLRPHLQSPFDRLVQTALLACWDWELTETLPEILTLYRMYPAADRWETDAVEHTTGTAASAKKEWMARFGHPLKQRARPVVFASLKRTLERLTGRTFASSDELAGYLADEREAVRARAKR